MKILTKILANSLNSFLPRLIKKDQVGFVPRRQAVDTIRRILQIQHITHCGSLETMFLSLDVNKTFDTLSWPYLTMVLRHYGFGASFLRWISALCNFPQAKVQYYGFESSLFPYQEGNLTRLSTLPALIHLCLGASGGGGSFSSRHSRCQGSSFSHKI